MMVERVLADMAYAGKIKYIALRYFNVAGADHRRRIGEGKPDATHLITTCVRAAAGILPGLSVFGTDYPTADGTCIRDYIHVEDLADAHIIALKRLLEGGQSDVVNCGYGHGFSVFEVIEAAKKITGVDFRVEYSPRRPGDPPELIAGNEKICRDYGWQPKYNDINDIIATAWEWEQERNRRGL